MVFKNLLRRFPILVWLVLVGALASNSVGASVRRPESLQACTKAPATPQLVSPANHAVVDPDHIILTWSAVEDATEYTVQVCADSTCSFVTTDATTAATSFDLTATAGTMPADLCVYWRARAENDCGASAYTSAWTFCSPGELGTVTPTGSPTAGTPTETATPSTTPTPSTTATTYTTVSVTPTTSVTATPSTTPTSSVTATPSTTPTPSVTPTPSTTSTPSVTPTPSTTADSIYVFGEVRDAASNAALRDVVVSLYRSDVGDWRLISERTTDANGHYAFGFSLAPQAHRIVETDPPGYTSDRVAIPSSLSGTAIDANTVEFQPPANGSYGPLVFYDRGAGATPTATGTAALTGTPTAPLTPTRSGDSARLWLPLLQNLFPH